MRTEERVSVSAFLDPDDHERLVELAQSEQRSVSGEIRRAIREHLNLSSGVVKAAGAVEGDDGTPIRVGVRAS